MWDFIDRGPVLRIYRPRAGQFSQEACISAHGGYSPSYGWAEVPDGAIVYFYQFHGSTQKDQASRTIMMGTSPKEVGVTSMGNGQVWNYQLTHYEHDAVQVPRDLKSMDTSMRTDARKIAMGRQPFGFSYRDVISIRTTNLPANLFPDGAVPLSYIFDEISKLSSYQAYHVCFCRFELFARGNRLGRTHVQRK